MPDESLATGRPASQRTTDGGPAATGVMETAAERDADVVERADISPETARLFPGPAITEASTPDEAHAPAEQQDGEARAADGR